MLVSQKTINNRHYRSNKIDGIKKAINMRKKIEGHAATYGCVILPLQHTIFLS